LNGRGLGRCLYGVHVEVRVLGASVSVEKFFACEVVLFCLCFGLCFCFCMMCGVLFAGVLWCVSTWFVVRFNVG